MEPTVFDLLDELALEIAEPLVHLYSIVTVHHYANFLSTVSWFADGNEQRHLIEANNPRNSPGLRSAFEEHGIEECDHWIYAVQDLQALGFVRTPSVPERVSRLHRQVDSWEAPQKLGYSALVETITQIVAAPLLKMKDRLALDANQFTFLALHLEADTGSTGHGAKQRRAAVENLSGNQWNRFYEGAFQGGKLWGEMMMEALQTPIYASRR